MTVEQLIKELHKYDPKWTVTISSWSNNFVSGAVDVMSYRKGEVDIEG